MKISDKKYHYIENIMHNLTGQFDSTFNCFKVSEKALFKLSLEEIKSLNKLIASLKKTAISRLEVIKKMERL